MQIESGTDGTPVRLEETLDRTLLLVGREALRNAVSHGQAQRVTVRLIFSTSQVTLEVQDDGTGFDVAPYRHDCEGNAHFGIIGMRERVEQVGGRLAIESGPGQGTLVSARVPLPHR